MITAQGFQQSRRSDAPLPALCSLTCFFKIFFSFFPFFLLSSPVVHLTRAARIAGARASPGAGQTQWEQDAAMGCSGCIQGPW